MTQPVQLSSTHLTILGEKVEIKDDRFYAISYFFETILNEYKKDADFWKESHYRKGEKVEIIINIIEPEYAYLESTKVTLRAFNMQGRLIWISSPIEENHYDILFRKVAYCMLAFVIIAGLGYLAI